MCVCVLCVCVCVCVCVVCVSVCVCVCVCVCACVCVCCVSVCVCVCCVCVVCVLCVYVLTSTTVVAVKPPFHTPSAVETTASSFDAAEDDASNGGQMHPSEPDSTCHNVVSQHCSTAPSCVYSMTDMNIYHFKVHGRVNTYSADC